jgi:tRNA (guanine-N7-)-methyltransferase
MGHKKLERFEAIRHMSNVLEHPKDMAGNWSDFFGNNHPIVLELACGKGEYTVGLADMHPNINTLGVDIKGNRIWKGASIANSKGLKNAAFLRTPIDHIHTYFAPNEVAEIWITFPDPQLRGSKAKKRLTHPLFLRRYQQFLQPNGRIHLKTDSPALFEFTKTVINLFELETLVDWNDAYAQPNIPQELAIRTYYESLDIAKSNRVHYLQFSINKPLPEEKDPILKELIREQTID